MKLGFDLEDALRSFGSFISLGLIGGHLVELLSEIVTLKSKRPVLVIEILQLLDRELFRRNLVFTEF